jgi:hypothetical protein
MFNFLFKRGDVRYSESETDWVRDTSVVKTNLLEMKEEVWGIIRNNAIHGNMADQVYIKRGIRLSEEDKAAYPDLYYAMNSFDLMMFVQYKAVQRHDCAYAITTAFVQSFRDDYDWHPGLQAGGIEPFIAAIPDAWPAALQDAGLAKEFTIYGVWHKPRATYLFSSSWLVPGTEPELITVLPEP